MSIQTPTIVREDDLAAHIDDSREFWVTRHGKPTKRRWRELTATERKATLKAERRAVYEMVFQPNY